MTLADEQAAAESAAFEACVPLDAGAELEQGRDLRYHRKLERDVDAAVQIRDFGIRIDWRGVRDAFLSVIERARPLPLPEKFSPESWRATCRGARPWDIDGPDRDDVFDNGEGKRRCGECELCTRDRAIERAARDAADLKPWTEDRDDWLSFRNATEALTRLVEWRDDGGYIAPSAAGPALDRLRLQLVGASPTNQAREDPNLRVAGAMTEIARALEWAIEPPQVRRYAPLEIARSIALEHIVGSLERVTRKVSGPARKDGTRRKLTSLRRQLAKVDKLVEKYRGALSRSEIVALCVDVRRRVHVDLAARGLLPEPRRTSRAWDEVQARKEALAARRQS